MKFTQLEIDGAYRVDLEKREDSRGFFARQFCIEEFKQHGLNHNWVQMNVSHSKNKGTLRGMHFQRHPSAEIKMVRCTAGKVFDVILDLRKNSETFGKWYGEELSAKNQRMLYIPKGVAHGFQTCEEHCELMYWHSEFYAPEYEGGVNPLDKDININWPLEQTEISDRDQNLPNFSKLESLAI